MKANKLHSAFFYANLPSMPPLFVYGTLLFPEMLNALLSRVPRYLDATLPEYRRFSIHDGPDVRPYPAILPEPKALVKGALLLGLSKEEGQILDAYEGEGYTKTACQTINACQTPKE
jgi:gamma-glutamylcyclotransferase (GGCT)/AIG2-like uncharacterized protein YtfP